MNIKTPFYLQLSVALLCASMVSTGLAQAQKTEKLAPPSTVAFKTRIDSDNDDILKLENGGIVQVGYGYLGYIGYRKKAILFGTPRQWKIWIEGKKTFKCDLLKAPVAKPSPAELTYILEVTGDGQILKMLDGAIYEVDSLDVIYTTLWLGMADALILNGSEVVNLDDGEIVTVTKLK